MRKLLLLISACLLSFSAVGQEPPAVWEKLKSITGDHYQVSVPDSLRQFPIQGKGLPEQYFIGSGGALPITFNQGPLIVNIFLEREDCSSLKECTQYCLEGYCQNPDRVFPAGWQDGQEKFTLSSGEEAVLLHTRFYRRSKELHQSRFDLVVYSEKAKTGYFYTLSVQHNDGIYKIETDLNLPAFAKSLFSRFQLL